MFAIGAGAYGGSESVADSGRRQPMSRSLRWFHADADPLRARYGPAHISHPEEYAAALDELRAAGVEIQFRPNDLAYQPRRGEPGKMVLDQDVSIAALRHEMRHFRDVRADGYPGLRKYMLDAPSYWRIEFRGYMEELRFARAHHDYESARKVLELMRQRRQDIYGLYGYSP